MVASPLPWNLGFVQPIWWYRGDSGQRVEGRSDLVAVDRRRAEESAVWYAFAFSIVYLFSTFAAYLVKKAPFS